MHDHVDPLTRARILGAQGSDPDEILELERGVVPTRIADMLTKTTRMNLMFEPVLALIIIGSYLLFIGPLVGFALFAGALPATPTDSGTLRIGSLAIAAVLLFACVATLRFTHRAMRTYAFDPAVPLSVVEGALTNVTSGRPGASWRVTIGSESFYVNAVAGRMLDDRYAYRGWFHARSRVVVLDPIVGGGSQRALG